MGGSFPLILELLQPELRAFERILTVARVEEHQRGSDVLQKDGMDLPIHVLTRQIPQYGFAVGAIFALETEFGDGPELLTVCGSVLLELAVRQPPAQARFAHARIADEHEFGGGVIDVLFCLTEQDGFIIFPDADDGVFFSEGGEDGEVGVEG